MFQGFICLIQIGYKAEKFKIGSQKIKNNKSELFCLILLIQFFVCLLTYSSSPFTGVLYPFFA